MLKDALIKAYQDNCLEKAKFRAEQATDLQSRAIAKLSAWMTALSANDEISSEINKILTVGELRLCYTTDYAGEIGFSLQDICPQCDSLCWSTYCYDPVSLGDQIVNFLPGPHHKCPYSPDCDYQPTKSTTWRDRLADAIRRMPGVPPAI